MVEEAHNDMSPQQEESVKSPLTGDSVAIQVKENAQDVDPRAQDTEEGFQGLTKEKLLEYANQPFWVRLRITLMVLFWVLWVAMLAIAILVIIKAPSCPPPPSSTWLEQNAMMELDVNAPIADVSDMMTHSDIKSLYVPELISSEDYRKLNPKYNLDTIVALFQNLTAASVRIVTDFVPSPISRTHVWTTNDNYSSFYDGTTMELDYNVTGLDSELEADFRFWQKTYNVTGFLVREMDSSDEDLQNLTTTLNERMNPEVAFGSRVIDMEPILGDLSDLTKFSEFVNDDRANDTFYKVHPVQDRVDEMQAVLLTLMTLSGTPVMGIDLAEHSAFTLNYTTIIKQGNKLRMQDSFKWGDVLFANTSSEVLGYTRTLKGAPAYAVAINTDATEEAVVDFSDVDHVPEDGTVEWEIRKQHGESKVKMANVNVAPLNGVIIQFVAKYD